MDAPDDLIRAELAQGERLLWAGRPRQGVVLRPIDLLAIPMGCFWCAGVGFAVALTLRDGSWPAALVALGFSVPGLYLLFGRAWSDAFQRRRTAYALTDRRLIFVRRLPRLVVGSQVRSFPLSSVGAITLRERRRGGGGTISFAGRTREEAWLVMSGIPGADDYHLPTFELAERAREVYALVLEAQRAGSPGAAAGSASPPPAAAPGGPSLRKRQAIVAGVIALGLAALLRWERWQCLDATGRVLAGGSGLLWPGQPIDPPPTVPKGGQRLEFTEVRLLPPLVLRRVVPVGPFPAPAVPPPAAPGPPGAER